MTCEPTSEADKLYNITSTETYTIIFNLLIMNNLKKLIPIVANGRY